MQEGGHMYFCLGRGAQQRGENEEEVVLERAEGHYCQGQGSLSLSLSRRTEDARRLDFNQQQQQQ